MKKLVYNSYIHEINFAYLIIKTNAIPEAANPPLLIRVGVFSAYVTDRRTSSTPFGRF